MLSFSQWRYISFYNGFSQTTALTHELKYLKVTVGLHSDTILNVFKCVTFLPVKDMKLHFLLYKDFFSSSEKNHNS